MRSFDSSKESFGWTALCSITYELEANLVRNKTFARSISQTRRLDFCTTRHIERPDPQLGKISRPIVCSSLAIQPGLEETPLSIKDKLKGLYSSKLPVAKSTLNMVMPRVVVAEKACPFYLEVDHDIESSSAPSPPLVRLKKLSIALEMHTYMQCPRDESLRDS